MCNVKCWHVGKRKILEIDKTWSSSKLSGFPEYAYDKAILFFKKTFVKQIIRADLSHLVMFLLPCHPWQWAQIWNKLNKVFNNEKVYSSDAISILLPFLSEFITQIYLLFKFFVYLNYYKFQWFILNQLLGRWNLDLSIKVKDLIPFLKKKNSDSQRAVSCLCWLTQ